MSPSTNTPTRKHRRQASVGSAFQAEREGALFDYFIVVGIPPPVGPIDSPLDSPVETPNSSMEDLTISCEIPKKQGNLKITIFYYILVFTFCFVDNIKVLYQYPPAELADHKVLDLSLDHIKQFCFPTGI